MNFADSFAIVLALVDAGVGLEHIEFAYAYPGPRHLGSHISRGIRIEEFRMLC
jgi:hypothetical protein